MKNKQIVFVISVLIGLVIACSSSEQETENSSTGKTSNKGNGSQIELKPTGTPTPEAPVKTAREVMSKCNDLKQPGKTFIAKQSFPFDYEPFPHGCFATFGSKSEMLDERDLPRGSTFYIYQDGESVYELPDAFAGITGCWVDAVSFKDLNNDGKMDVIMAGRCLGAKNSYPSNAVYVNDGSGFTTDDFANGDLVDLKSVKAIETYVKGHMKDFFH